MQWKWTLMLMNAYHHRADRHRHLRLEYFPLFWNLFSLFFSLLLADSSFVDPSA